MTNIYVNDEFSLEVNESLTYNFQSASVADMSLSKSNYTSSFKIPKIPHNVRHMQGLGIVSDKSTIPYTVNKARVVEDYTPVYTGSLVVLKTSYDYEATVISGTRDIFSLLGDQTFADILAVSSILPIKSPIEVANYALYSPNKNVTFITANYGGVSHIIKDGEVQINVDCQTVAYRIKFLWDSIFSHIGISFDLRIPSSDLNDEYLTFPYPPYPEVVSMGDLAFDGVIRPYLGFLNSGNTVPSAWKVWASSTGVDFYLSGWAIVCQNTGSYIIDIPTFIAEEGGFITTTPFDVAIIKNGSEIARFRSDLYGSSNPDKSTYKGVHSFFYGDVITIELYRINGRTSDDIYSIQSAFVRIYRPTFSDESKKSILNVKLKDFVKEFMYRFALMGFYDNDYMIFTKVGSIMNSPDVVDWSDKYVDRSDGEIYDIGYSQNNFLKHKYFTEGSSYYDKNLNSNNMNLSLSKDIVVSSFFAPSQNSAVFSLGGSPSTEFSYESKLFETYSGDGSSKIKTENRNFWISGQQLFVSGAYYGSKTMSDRSVITTSSIFSSEYQAAFNQSTDWVELTRFLYDTRVRTITLSLNITDISNLDLKKIYYFEQESDFFMINKLQFKKGEKSKAEFIRILRF